MSIHEASIMTSSSRSKSLMRLSVIIRSMSFVRIV